MREYCISSYETDNNDAHHKRHDHQQLFFFSFLFLSFKVKWYIFYEVEYIYCKRIHIILAYSFLFEEYFLMIFLYDLEIPMSNKR